MQQVGDREADQRIVPNLHQKEKGTQLVMNSETTKMKSEGNIWICKKAKKESPHWSNARQNKDEGNERRRGKCFVEITYPKVCLMLRT